jgi:hypothetical protein
LNEIFAVYLLDKIVTQFTRRHRCDWWAPSDWPMSRLNATLEPPLAWLFIRFGHGLVRWTDWKEIPEFSCFILAMVGVLVEQFHFFILELKHDFQVQSSSGVLYCTPFIRPPFLFSSWKTTWHYNKKGGNCGGNSDWIVQIKKKKKTLK